MNGPRKTPGEDAAGRCRACLTAFSSGSLRSRPQCKAVRHALRATEPAVLRTSGSNKPKSKPPPVRWETRTKEGLTSTPIRPGSLGSVSQNGRL
jgi:hypothetical protein